MKRIWLVIILVLLLSSCNALGDDASEATLSYCTDNPSAAICDDFDTNSAIDKAINTLFNEMITDYNNDNDITCEDYFKGDLISSCNDNNEFFGPDEITELTLLEIVLDDESNLLYTATFETDSLLKVLEVTIGFDYSDNEIRIDQYTYQLKNDSSLSTNEVIALSFMEEYNDSALSHETVCAKWLENSIDASNCQMIRRTHLSNNNTLSFIKIENYDYPFAVYSLSGESGSSSQIRYVIYESGKVGTASYAFQISDEFNTNSFKFINDLAYGTYPDFVACDLIDHGSSLCSDIENDVQTLGIYNVNYGTAQSNYYTNNELIYHLTFTLIFDDESERSFTIECKNDNGDHTYTLTED